MADTTRQRLLRQAIEKFGSDIVARGLNSPQHFLDAWMQGFGHMPDGKWVELANLIDKLEGHRR